jgi:hypothetical protein
MDDWYKQVNDWLNHIGEQVETTVTTIADAAETAGKEMADRLDRELAPWLAQWVQPLLDTPLDLDFDFDQAIDDVIQPWRQTLEPPLNNHPLCAGCQHYHGQAYGGDMLVCGMHPYGPMADQTSCGDKTPIDWQEPWKTWFKATGFDPDDLRSVVDHRPD